MAAEQLCNFRANVRMRCAGRKGEQRDPAGLEREERAVAAAPDSALLVCAVDGAALARSQRLKGGGDSRGDSRGDASTHTQENVAHT